MHCKLRHIICLLLLLPFFAQAKTDPAHIIDSLLQELDKPVHDTTRVNTLNTLAKHLRNVNTSDAMRYATEALTLSERTDYQKGKATAADVLGVIYLNIAEYQTALYHLFTALRINEALHFEKGVAGTCNNIGSVYFHLKKYDEASVYYNRSLEMKLKLGMMKEASSSYINLANIFMKQDRLKECIDYYRKALDNARANSDDYNESIALMNLGEAYIDQHKDQLALAYYYQALDVNEKRADIFHLTNCYYAIGKIFTNMKRYDEAEKNFQRSIALAQKGNIRSMKLNIYRYFSRLYEAQHKYEQSLEYFKLYHTLSDSVYNTESAEKMSEIQAKYETEQKDQQIELLNKDKDITEAKVNREKLLRNFFVVAFVFICIIAGVLGRNMLLKQRVNKILQEKNEKIGRQQAEIEQKNRELDAYNQELMRENISVRYEVLKSKVNPHFLFNSLATLSSLIISDPKEALQFVSHFSRLYRSILEFGNHRLVTVKDEMAFVKNYLYLQHMRFKENLHTDVEIDPKLYQHLVPPFAIQLLIENALKHNVVSSEHPLRIKVLGQQNELRVINNLQKKASVDDSTGIGREHIIARYQSISDIAPVFEEANGYYYASIPLIQPGTNV